MDSENRGMGGLACAPFTKRVLAKQTRQDAFLCGVYGSGLGFGDERFRFGVWGSGFGVWVLGSGIWGLGFRQLWSGFGGWGMELYA